MKMRYAATMPDNVKVAEDQSGQFSGYVALYGNLDDAQDVIVKGAFTKGRMRSVKRGPNKGKIKVLDSHHTLVGYCKATPDDKGVFVEGQISLDYVGAADVHQKMLDGGYDCMSAGFNVPRGYAEWNEDYTEYKIKRAELWEASVCMFGMNREALVESVKSALGPIQTIREFEDFLRDSGQFTRKQATAIALSGFKALDQGEPGQSANRAILSELNDLLADSSI